MATKNSFNWGSVAVRADKGSENIWDRQATLDKMTADLDIFIKLQETDTALINEQITEMFAGEKSKVSYNTGALTTLIMNEVGFDKDTYAPLKSRVEEVLGENSRVYSIKGPGGGVRYMSDEEFAHYQATNKNPAEVLADAKEAVKALKKAAK